MQSCRRPVRRSSCGRGRRGFARTAGVWGHEGVNAAGGERDDPRAGEAGRHEPRDLDVHPVEQLGCGRGAKLDPRQEKHGPRIRQRRHRRRIGEVGGLRRDAVAGEVCPVA